MNKLLFDDSEEFIFTENDRKKMDAQLLLYLERLSWDNMLKIYNVKKNDEHYLIEIKKIEKIKSFDE